MYKKQKLFAINSLEIGFFFFPFLLQKNHNYANLGFENNASTWNDQLCLMK
jgi:hypothetical protein